MRTQHPAAIMDVTDTALWVAALRANESRRTDAAFQDPFAVLLRAAPLLFHVDDWFKFLEECSWRRRQVISEMRARILGSSGAVLLERCPG